MTDISSFFTDDGRVDARQLNSGRGPKIDAETCATLRRRYRRNQPQLKDLAAEYDVAATTVKNHVYHRCNHEHDEPLAEGDA